MFGRRKVAMLVAEFLGTGILTLLILSVQRSTIGVPFFVALAAGITYALMTFAFARSSGAVLNPALTIGMWTARKISTVNAVLFIGVQLLGGWAAYGLYTYFVNQTLQPVGGHFTGRILVAEAVGAGILSFGVAAAVYQRFTAGTAAAVAGLAYVVGVVGASSASIGLLNPAVALGARAWVWGTYVLGPVLGAVIGFNLYSLLFAEAEDAAVNAVRPATAKAVPATNTAEAAAVNGVAAKPSRRVTTTKATRAPRQNTKSQAAKTSGSKPRSSTRTKKK
ncbi:MAG: aquaporin [Patescibacteria group bacterium]|nr:aquaporin [Patescibacteria group bacterium]